MNMNRPDMTETVTQAVKWLPERNGCTPDGLVFGGLPNTSNLCVSLKNWADKAGVKKNVRVGKTREHRLQGRPPRRAERNGASRDSITLIS